MREMPEDLRRTIEARGPRSFWGFLMLQARYGEPPWWADADRWLKLDESKRAESIFFRNASNIFRSMRPKKDAV